MWTQVHTPWAGTMLTQVDIGERRGETSGVCVSYAVARGIKQNNQYLYGRKFTLFSDNKPLTSIFRSKKIIPIYAANRL